MAMEDFRVDVVVGKGPGATAIPLEIPPFTLVGATTRAGLLPGPLRDRFGFTGAPGVLRAGRARAGSCAARAGLLGVDLDRRRAPPRSPAAPAARRASPTGCCAGSATTPQVRGRRRGHPRRRPRGAGRSTRSTSSASTGSTGRCSTRCAAASAAARSGVVHARRRGGRGARDRRGGRRAVPGARRAAGPHAARPGRHRRRPGAHLGLTRCRVAAARSVGGRPAADRCAGRRVRRQSRCSAPRLHALARNPSGRGRARPVRSPVRARAPCSRRTRAVPHRARTAPRSSTRGREAHLSWSSTSRSS